MALVLLSCALASPPARAAAPADDAAVLLEQGRQHEKAGQVDVALDLYRAAALVAPKEAEAHRLVASALISLDRCVEAIPELHAYLELAPASAQSQPAYAQAVVDLAKCLKKVQATLEVHPSDEARCAVDGGPAKVASEGLPATFQVMPGPHEVSCTRDGHAPATTKVIVAAQETMQVIVGLEPVPMRAPPFPRGEQAVMPTADGFVLPPTPGPPPAKTTGDIEIQAQGAPWSCRVDGGAPVTFDAADKAHAAVLPGDHVVDCDHPGSQHLQAHLATTAGGQRVVRVRPYPLAPTMPPTEAPQPSAPRSSLPAPTPEGGDPHAHSLEWRIAGGIGPELGTFGAGVGARYGAFELMLGSGFYPFAVTGTYYLHPGRTSIYFSAGYLRVGQGVIGAGSEIAGFGLWASGGIDVRSGANLAFRIGIGPAYNSTGLAEAPLVYDVSLAYLP